MSERKREPERCTARTVKGICDLPVDEYGYCDRPSDHIEESHHQ